MVHVRLLMTICHEQMLCEPGLLHNGGLPEHEGWLRGQHFRQGILDESVVDLVTQRVGYVPETHSRFLLDFINEPDG